MLNLSQKVDTTFKADIIIVTKLNNLSGKSIFRSVSVSEGKSQEEIVKSLVKTRTSPIYWKRFCGY